MHHLASIFDDVFDSVYEKPLKTRKARLRGLFLFF